MRSPLSILCAALVVATTVDFGDRAIAQTYPSKPIRLIVPFAPGGGNDNVARLIGSKLGQSLGQQVIIDNQPGGSTVVGSQLAARSAPDGYTMYLVGPAFACAPSQHRNLTFDSLRDFAPITRLATTPGAVTVHASLPVSNVRELIALAKARPGQVTYGSAGVGSGAHLGAELFKQMAGVDMLHVPYKSSALTTNAMLSGEVAVAFSNPVSSLPFVKSGRLKMIAITSAERWPLLPQVVTVAESGVPGYAHMGWQGLVVPSATPQPVIARLHRELTDVVKAPEISRLFAEDASLAMTEPPAQFATFMANEIAKCAKLLKAAGVAPE